MRYKKCNSWSMTESPLTYSATCSTVSLSGSTEMKTGTVSIPDFSSVRRQKRHEHDYNLYNII